MAGKNFVVLYTHQKRKKSKVWQDGTLRVGEQGTKATLFGDGSKRLDQLHIKPNQANVGEELESEKYLITIEELKEADDSSEHAPAPSENVPQRTSALQRKGAYSLSHQPPIHSQATIRNQPVKRKRMGFVPPRQVSSGKPSPQKENVTDGNNAHGLNRQSAISMSSKQPSSLFSAPWGNAKSVDSQYSDILNMYGRSTVGSSLPADVADDKSTTKQAVNSFMPSDNNRESKYVGMTTHAKGQFEGDDRLRFTSDPGPDKVGNCNDIGRFRDHIAQDTMSDLPNRTEDSSLDKASGYGLANSKQMHPYPSGPSSIEDPGKMFNQFAQEQELDKSQPQLPHLTPSSRTTYPTEQPAQSTTTVPAKRSASQILALLGRGRKTFQPPLKQKPPDLQRISPEPSLPPPPQKRAPSSNIYEQSDANVPFHQQEDEASNSDVQKSLRCNSSAMPNSQNNKMGATNKMPIHKQWNTSTSMRVTHFQQDDEKCLDFTNKFDPKPQLPLQLCDSQENTDVTFQDPVQTGGAKATQPQATHLKGIQSQVKQDFEEQTQEKKNDTTKDVVKATTTMAPSPNAENRLDPTSKDKPDFEDQTQEKMIDTTKDVNKTTATMTPSPNAENRLDPTSKLPETTLNLESELDIPREHVSREASTLQGTIQQNHDKQPSDGILWDTNQNDSTASQSTLDDWSPIPRSFEIVTCMHDNVNREECGDNLLCSPVSLMQNLLEVESNLSQVHPAGYETSHYMDIKETNELHAMTVILGGSDSDHSPSEELVDLQLPEVVQPRPNCFHFNTDLENLNSAEMSRLQVEQNEVKECPAEKHQEAEFEMYGGQGTNISHIEQNEIQHEGTNFKLTDNDLEESPTVDRESCKSKGHDEHVLLKSLSQEVGSLSVDAGDADISESEHWLSRKNAQLRESNFSIPCSLSGKLIYNQLPDFDSQHSSVDTLDFSQDTQRGRVPRAGFIGSQQDKHLTDVLDYVPEGTSFQEEDAIVPDMIRPLHERELTLDTHTCNLGAENQRAMNSSLTFTKSSLADAIEVDTQESEQFVPELGDIVQSKHPYNTNQQSTNGNAVVLSSAAFPRSSSNRRAFFHSLDNLQCYNETPPPEPLDQIDQYSAEDQYPAEDHITAALFDHSQSHLASQSRRRDLTPVNADFDKSESNLAERSTITSGDQFTENLEEDTQHSFQNMVSFAPAEKSRVGNPSLIMEYSSSWNKFGQEAETCRQVDLGEARMEPELQSAQVTRKQGKETTQSLHRTGYEDLESASRTAGFADTGVLRLQTERHNHPAVDRQSMQVLPHPSDLKTPNKRRNAAHKQPAYPVEQVDVGQKDDIYWKRSVSSGRVRRQPQNLISNTYRQETAFPQQRINPLQGSMFHSDQDVPSHRVKDASNSDTFPPRSGYEGHIYENTPPTNVRDRSLCYEGNSVLERIAFRGMGDQSGQSIHTSDPLGNTGRAQYPSPVANETPDLSLQGDYQRMFDDVGDRSSTVYSSLFSPEADFLQWGSSEAQRLRQRLRDEQDLLSQRHAFPSPIDAFDDVSLYSLRQSAKTAGHKKSAFPIDGNYIPTCIHRDEFGRPEQSPQSSAPLSDYISNGFLENGIEGLKTSPRSALPQAKQWDLYETLSEGSVTCSKGDIQVQRSSLDDEDELRSPNNCSLLPSTDHSFQIESGHVVGRDRVSSSSVSSNALHTSNMGYNDKPYDDDVTSGGKGPHRKHHIPQWSDNNSRDETDCGKSYQDDRYDDDESVEPIFHSTQEAEMVTHSNGSREQNQGIINRVQCVSGINDDDVVDPDTDVLSPGQLQEMGSMQNAPSPDLFSTQQDEQHSSDRMPLKNETLTQDFTTSDGCMNGHQQSVYYRHHVSGCHSVYQDPSEQVKRKSSMDFSQDCAISKDSTEVEFKREPIRTYQKRALIARPSASECNTPLPSIFHQVTSPSVDATERPACASDECGRPCASDHCGSPSSIAVAGCDSLNDQATDETSQMVRTSVEPHPQSAQDHHSSMYPRKNASLCDHEPLDACMLHSLQEGKVSPQISLWKPECGHNGYSKGNEHNHDIAKQSQDWNLACGHNCYSIDNERYDDNAKQSHDWKPACGHNGYCIDIEHNDDNAKQCQDDQFAIQEELPNGGSAADEDFAVDQAVVSDLSREASPEALDILETEQEYQRIGQTDWQGYKPVGSHHRAQTPYLRNQQVKGAPCLPRKSGGQTPSTDSPAALPCGRQGSGEASRGFRTPVVKGLTGIANCVGRSGDLIFPSAETVTQGTVPQRKVVIPVSFPNASSYKQVLSAAVKEHLAILLHEVSHRYHSALSKADTSTYAISRGMMMGRTAGGSQAAGSGENQIANPLCKHEQPAKMVCVKKEGPNKGRMFYACNNPRETQCKFFLWADQHTTGQSSRASDPPVTPSGGQGRAKIPLPSAEAVESFARSHQVHLYCESQLSRRGGLNDGLLPGAPKWVKKYRAQQVNNTSKKLYLKLHRKEHSSTYAKDDLWVISQDLTFDPASSFLAKSAFHGPSSSNEIEIEPVTGYSPSNWPSTGTVYGILACNASTELSCLDNMQENLNPRTLPILPHLVNSTSNSSERSTFLHASAFVSPTNTRHLNVPPEQINEMVQATIGAYHLNNDQATALQLVAGMLATDTEDNETPSSITLIHGVFGAGKSYLLAVTVLFLVQLFNLSEQSQASKDREWKVLIASTTNVAVDRILLGLLDLGFEDFIRVGSMRKIAKPILPYSVHASDKENQEVRELQEMLKGDLTPGERQLVRHSLERQRLGKNKDLMSKVKVIGVTCAACSFPCIKNLTFPVVLLDECSQMTEPASLLPLARFGCEKLVLVGDPHQLNPTIQGTEPAHKSGLEQTLFDRLTLMGYDPVVLRTQYRCHPRISALANALFYEDNLLDGVIEEERPPLVDGLPTLCFFNVSHGQEMCARDGSYFNDPEATFVVFLIGGLLKMGVAPRDIGVITLYKAQVSRINTLLQTSGAQMNSEVKAIQISTVDAFQGGEKAIIILSCVRTQRVGFIDSDKRTNVALTRSKNHLLIVGGMKMLSENALWGEIIHKCQEHPDGVKDSKAFQKYWEERIDRMEEEQQREDDQPERKRKRRKMERKKTPRQSAESQEMSLDEDDDFVISGTRNTLSPVPFDACTPATPISPINQMEQSNATSSHDITRPFHFHQKGETLPEIALEGLHWNNTNVPANDSVDGKVEETLEEMSEYDLATILKPSSVQESGQTSNTSFSYSPLQEVEESDSEDSDEELPNFDIGNILDF